MSKLLVLNYHEILRKGDFSSSPYAISEELFQQHLDIIARSGKRVISLSELCKGNPDNNCIAITFDDGNLSDFKIASPVLIEFGFTATFFPSVIAIIDQPEYREWMKTSAGFFSFGSHGWHHLPMTVFSAEILEYELIESKKYIESIVSIETEFFSAPFGMVNDHVINAVFDAGYQNIMAKDTKILRIGKSPVRERISVHTNTTAKKIGLILKRDRATRIKCSLKRLLHSIMEFLIGFELLHEIHLRFHLISQKK